MVSDSSQLRNTAQNDKTLFTLHSLLFTNAYMRILITGINGFAGSHLLDYIISNKNVEIFGIVRDQSAVSNVQRHVKSIKLFYGDLSERDFTSRIITSVKPDRLFHLAGSAHSHSLQQNSWESFLASIMGTVNVLESVRISGGDTRILIVSSGYIYGGRKSNEELPDENSSFLPTDPYSAGKTSVDHISQVYRIFYGMDVVIARPFNHTGPRQKTAFVCSAIASQFAGMKKQKDAMLKLGNVESRRDFTDVRDVVRAYWLMCAERKQDAIFNISSGSTFSVTEIVKMLEELTGNHPVIEVDSSRLRKSDFSLVAGKSDRLRSTFGWKPEIPFEKTLRDLYEYHQMPS